MAVTNTVSIVGYNMYVTLKDASDTSTTGDIYWSSAAMPSAGLPLGCASTQESFYCRSITWYPAGTTGQLVQWRDGSLTGPIIYRGFFGAGSSTLADVGFTKQFIPPIRIKPVWDASENTFTTGGSFTFSFV